MRRSRSPEDSGPADLAQARSKPLEKNLPSAMVTKADDALFSARIWCRADSIASRRLGFSLCSPEPVSVRRKMLPRFSKVHISLSLSLSQNKKWNKARKIVLKRKKMDKISTEKSRCQVESGPAFVDHPFYSEKSQKTNYKKKKIIISRACLTVMLSFSLLILFSRTYKLFTLLWSSFTLFRMNESNSLFEFSYKLSTVLWSYLYCFQTSTYLIPF